MGAKVTYNSEQVVNASDIWDRHFVIICTKINQLFFVIQLWNMIRYPYDYFMKHLDFNLNFLTFLTKY